MTEGGFPYPAEGPHTIVSWCSSGPSIVVARLSMPGRPWGRMVRKIGQPGWWATAHKTRRDALRATLPV